MLYGRDAERAEIAALLDAARESRSGVLVLRGEPGVGKTALLLAARERASDMHVLNCPRDRVRVGAPVRRAAPAESR